MKPSSLSDALKRIAAYRKSDTPYPFFVLADGSMEYSSVVKALNGLSIVRVSDYCRTDSFPDVDQLIADIKKIESGTLLLGVGESIALGGSSTLLGKLRDLLLPHKLIVVCRGIREDIRRINEVDRKFNERRYTSIQSSLDYSVVSIDEGIPCYADKGFKRFLSHLEEGLHGEVRVKTALSLKNVQKICSCHTLLEKDGRITGVDESVLPEECWRAFLEDDSLEESGYREWRFYLNVLINGTKNPYLQLVIEKSPDYETYQKMIARAILHVPCESPQFPELYSERKQLLHDASESYMALYVAETKQKGEQRIHYLTDNTVIERDAIIESICESQAIPPDLETIYPALGKYLFDYAFACRNNDLFDRYFSRYKRQKLMNTIEPSFLDEVVMLAKDGNRAYNALDTRNAIVEQAEGEGAQLYWVDALGVEYLGYIQQRSHDLGLSMRTHVARASLPTLTCMNKSFYEEWKGDKTSRKDFDKLKHNGEDRFNYETEKLPIHLVRELSIIDEVLEFAQTQLSARKYRKIVIASDHGASRLAVIANSEAKWEMTTKGEHSGRCCPESEIDEKPDCATAENGYWVLANYDRFKGGRKASVEVHGGASLEEVLVPVIELSLRDASVEITCLTKVAYASYEETPEIELFSTSHLANVTVRLNGRVYEARKVDENRHIVRFDGVTKAGTYTCEVYEKDDRIGVAEFEVQKRSATTNDDDWFM